MRTSVACLCNLGTSNPALLAERVADVVLAARLAPKAGIPARDDRPTVSLPADALQRLSGFYEDVVTGVFRRVEVKDGELMAFGERLRAVAPDRFVPPGGGLQLHFPPAASGGPQELAIIRDGRDPETCRRVLPPANATLEEFAGSYYSDELDAIWTLAVREGRLTCQVLNGSPTVLTLVKPDVFLSDGGRVLRFERDAGLVRRVSVQAGRVANLVFVKR